MTLDNAIAALQAAREKVGGKATLWVNRDGVEIKWDEWCVVAIVPIQDGESEYVQLTCRKDN